MKIEKLVIENFKSIERIELVQPNPFTVFVGPNGAGKSNIFEALEFVHLKQILVPSVAVSLFGGKEKINPKNKPDFTPIINLSVSHFRLEESGSDTTGGIVEVSNMEDLVLEPDKALEQFLNFCRLFVSNVRLDKLPFTDNQRLSLSATNLEPVLKRILANSILKAEIFEWLELFVPGFKAVEVDDRNELHWFEEGHDSYFTKDLISDGTYNILALLAAVYQSDDQPQFLCIEEPENGLHPQVLMTLVDFFREQCAEKGHYIWLNTHSESIVRKLTTDEIILVNKRDGATETRQIKGRNIYDLPTEEAWLTGALGGGLPW